MYKFVEENENGSFSCETCDCSQMSSNELHVHIDLYHCAEKRDAFNKECFLKISNHPDFKLWEQETAHVPQVTFASIEEKEIHDEKLESKTEKKVLKMSERSIEQNENEDTHKETFTITRQRSSGPNILEAERCVYTIQDDGTKKKTIIKDVFAKVTTRKPLKRKIDDHEENVDPKSKIHTKRIQ